MMDVTRMYEDMFKVKKSKCYIVDQPGGRHCTAGSLCWGRRSSHRRRARHRRSRWAGWRPWWGSPCRAPRGWSSSASRGGHHPPTLLRKPGQGEELGRCGVRGGSKPRLWWQLFRRKVASKIVWGFAWRLSKDLLSVYYEPVLCRGTLHRTVYYLGGSFGWVADCPWVFHQPSTAMQ